MENLYKRLTKYSDSDYYPYHMPGHKRQPLGNRLDEVFALDITEIDGFDNLHQAEDLLVKEQEKASRLYGAEETHYLVNGSTCGILCALSATVRQGGHILLARNSHKAAYHGVYLRNLQVTYLYPEYDEDGIALGICASQVKHALEQEPEIEAVFITSPTYEGRVSEIAEIVQVAHEKGIPVIVDEAHGAHFGIHPAWPQNSNRAGADIVIHSVHKTLPSMTQTALLHVNGTMINREMLRRFLSIYQSSSPSYIFMASTSQAIEYMEQKGIELFEIFLKQWQEMINTLSRCEKIKILATDDIGKLIISVRGTNFSGKDLYHTLLENYHLQLEMSASTYALAMFTVADKREGYERMTEALLAVDKQLSRMSDHKSFVLLNKKSDGEMRLSDAWDAPKEEVTLLESIGRRAGEFVSLYPPGIPLLVPGEKITVTDAEWLQDLCKKGWSVQGIYNKDDIHKMIVIE